ncbi:hypothetical protein PHMEG_00029881 [Phytophthora megakarya]|uniref:PiggyBac transposable element-derived protein domain-containing protein n=1 Tax=Phytophthora megakarya TaxID=4795 RepID=A0A225V2G6_9STRA|nr:hypothetical protein PHMEG_00029881 [Phytophthora megakarya]
MILGNLSVHLSTASTYAANNTVMMDCPTQQRLPEQHISAKQYCREYGEGTAVVLRLANHYKGTGQTVVADSAFASVKTWKADWDCFYGYGENRNGRVSDEVLNKVVRFGPTAWFIYISLKYNRP